MICKIENIFISDVEGIDDAKPPTMPLKGRSFIRSMIFHSAADGGFGGGPPPVLFACLKNHN